MITEGEILSKYRQSLNEAQSQCDWLGKQQDPDLAGPRGWRYTALRKAVQELEGCCRQMAHHRADARWVKLGILYAKALRTIQVKFVAQKWGDFAKLTSLFDMGLRNMEDLATRKTGKVGMILPTQPTDWLILPDLKVPNPSRFREVMH